MARIIRAGDTWELLSLSAEQKAQLLTDLSKENLSLMKICLRDAENVVCDTLRDPEIKDILGVAVALFDKLATKSYSRYMEAEVIKTFREKNQAAQVEAVCKTRGSEV